MGRYRFGRWFVIAAASLGCTPESRGALEARLAREAPVARTFAFPVGPRGSAKGYYDAQPFGENGHLGSDWNGVGGGNSDLGDPVFAIGDGVVLSAADHGGGWGRVVRVVHNLGPRAAPRFVESLYAHLDTMHVIAGARVRQGQPIGTIGTAHGRYPAHLHFELRARLGLPLGRGYGPNSEGYLDPSAFIRAHAHRKDGSRG